MKILYIDDNPEPALAKYLDRYQSPMCAFEYSDIRFNPDEGYESLINNPEVKSANIIFIDSRLFENRTATTGNSREKSLKSY